jgi:hypothetical protein
MVRESLLVTPARLIFGTGSTCAFVASIRIRPRQSISLRASYTLTQCVARMTTSQSAACCFGPAVADERDKISKRFRTSRIGNDNAMTSVYKMSAKRTRRITGTYKSYFMTSSSILLSYEAFRSCRQFPSADFHEILKQKTTRVSSKDVKRCATVIENRIAFIVLVVTVFPLLNCVNTSHCMLAFLSQAGFP